jgi:hypothetical protein
MANQTQADQFSPEEMTQVQRHGKALLGEPTDFDEAVESHLADHYPHEASAAKMRAAAEGGGGELGPSQMDEQAVKQQNALMAQQTSQGAQQAVQAQAAQVPNQPPPAPTGPTGVSIPYAAQRGQQTPPDVTAMPPSQQEQGQQGPPQ